MQRLNLQVLWTQPPPYENARVCGIGWRPDERILAIGKKMSFERFSFSFIHSHFQRLQQRQSDFGRCGKTSDTPYT